VAVLIFKRIVFVVCTVLVEEVGDWEREREGER
jgi:hypothetical protein